MRQKTLLALMTYDAKGLNPNALADAEAATEENRVLWWETAGAAIAYRTSMRAYDLAKVLIGDGRRGLKHVRVFELGTSWWMSGETVNHAWLQRHLGDPSTFE